MEEWKDIPDYEGFYQASNLGHIRSVDRILYRKGKTGAKTNHQKTAWLYKGRLLIPKHTNHGYYFCSLVKQGKGRARLLHRFIAKTFIPNPQNLPVVNHKDGNKLNNKVSNLEWCTQKENNAHALKHSLTSIGKKGEDSPRAKLTSSQVLEIRKKYIPDKHTLLMLAEEYNVTYGTISKIILRTTWSHL